MELSRREFGGRSIAGPGGASRWASLAREIGLKVGVPDWSLRRAVQVSAVELAKRIGFDGLEVKLGRGPERLQLSDPELQQQYLEAARTHNLPIVSTCLNILHRNYLKNDPLGKRWVAESIPITSKLGAHVILLPFFGRGALETRQEMEYVADFLREVAPEAERAGVILGLEATISAEDNVRIMERTRSNAVLVYYDVGNSTRNGFDAVKEIRWLGRNRICEFHLKDNQHYLGEGKIDFPAILDAIAEIGFEGFAHLETDSPSNDVESDMKRNLKYVRDLLTKRS